MIGPSSLIRFGALASAFAFLACAPKRQAQSQRLPDGSIRLVCQSSLQQCLDTANLLCKDGTYDVLRARDQRDHFGAELGTSQVETRTSEAVIRCGSRGSVPEVEATTAAPVAATPPPPPSRPEPPRACVPGATQACVGPGACEGGQSCLPSGAGFGPCDCGTIGAPVTAPKPPAAGSEPPAAAPPRPPAMPGTTRDPKKGPPGPPPVTTTPAIPLSPHAPSAPVPRP